ncbi:Tetraketide alpha-pyrone reductase 1 [Morella rubra]|uniref:Tetraketide alpha-pyrone reductase 1 n=2 Tax=Morella rubra TaxID=262757 RepID=A0A6A1WM94_9ROSI|nr:Tetraketide alpha-pyrone reductase 1 [Morella rubra]
MKQKLKRIPKKVGTKIRSKVIATLLRMRHRAITCKNQILINNFFHDHFDLDYTRHEDVRTVVETMMTARRTHRNRMHAYFKKFPSKEAALLKPHPDTTEEQWKELCDLFTSEAFMKRSEQNKKNRSKLTVNHAAGSRSFQRTRACMERMDAFQRQCDLEGKTYTEIEVYSEILGKKSGYVRGLGRAVKPPPSSTLTTQSSDLQHQLAKARDEIEAMRAAREKDLQEFAKKQAEMEATLRDHREEQRVEQERIRLEQEERMKREQERMRVEHEERMQQEQERMRKEQERLRAEISKELEKKMSSVMEKKMSDMSKRLFSQFGGSKRVRRLQQHELGLRVELIEPAVKGTIKNLSSCCKASSVKRVVITSSMVAIALSGKPLTPDVQLDKNSFSDPAFCEKSKLWYMLSKTLPEAAAWKFVKENEIDMLTINPSWVIGPIANSKCNCGANSQAHKRNNVVPFAGLLAAIAIMGAILLQSWK